MWIIEMQEWLGPGNRMTPEEVSRTTAKTSIAMFWCRDTLAEGLQRIAAYQRAYNDHYLLAVNFTLVNVRPLITEIDNGLLEFFNVDDVLQLEQTAQDFER